MDTVKENKLDELFQREEALHQALKTQRPPTEKEFAIPLNPDGTTKFPGTAIRRRNTNHPKEEGNKCQQK